MTGRARCPACLRALQTCICRWRIAVPSEVEVLILQHEMEVDNAKGSARLLHLCLPNSSLRVGEQFPQDELDQALNAGGRQPVLLYPDTPEAKSLGVAAPPALESECLANPSAVRLVVLDATWRKSRKMLYLNRALQALPRLPLRDTPASHYLIRKAQAPEQLSTLEATCYALMRLEHEPARYKLLLDAFDGFVAQQLSYLPSSPQSDFA